MKYHQKKNHRLRASSNSGIPSNATSQSSTVMPSVVSDWSGGAWLVDCPGSSDFSSLGAGFSTSIASGGVGLVGGAQAASGSDVGAGCLTSRCRWLPSLSLAFLFSFSC